MSNDHFGIYKKEETCQTCSISLKIFKLLTSLPEGAPMTPRGAHDLEGPPHNLKGRPLTPKGKQWPPEGGMTPREVL